jgi:genome maintenance exonuclease 1
MFDGKASVIDFKTANKRKQRSWISNYFMQESAYAVMFEERTSIPIGQLVTIIAVEQDEPQLFVERRDDYIMDFIKYRDKYEEQQKCLSG